MIVISQVLFIRKDLLAALFVVDYYIQTTKFTTTA